MKSSLQTNPVRIGTWLVEPMVNKISSPERSVRVEPRIMRVLLELVDHAGSVCTREALVAQVWPDTIVNEDALTHAISDLRKIFGDTPRSPRFIQTIPKVGYRLIAPVSYPDVPTLEPRGDGYKGSPSTQTTVPIFEVGRPARHSFSSYIAVGLSIVIVGVLSWWLFSPTVTTTAQGAARPIPLTTLPGFEDTPALSPDGTRLAFAWSEHNQHTFDLYVMLVNERRPVQLTKTKHAAEGNPAWSPDGTQLAFIRTTDTTCGVYVMPALGGNERKLIDCFPGSLPDLAWSPTGEWLAYADKEFPDRPSRIYLLSPETFEHRPLTSPPAQSEGDQQVAFAPDGQSVAFIRTRIRGINDVYRVDLDGRDPIRLTSDDRMISSLAWSAQDNALIFASGAGCIPGLWRLPEGSERPTWIAVAGDMTNHPSLSQDGQRMAFASWHIDTNIWQLDLTTDDAPATSTIASTRWDGSPDLSPDGTQVAFVSGRSGSLEVWVWDQGDARERQLTRFGGPHLGAPRWSPDGQYLAFDVRMGGQSAIYTVALESGKTERVTEPGANNTTPSWSFDGHTLYFASDRTEQWQIWQQDVGGGEAAQITQHGGFRGFEAQDGTFYYARRDTAGVWHKADDGTEKLLIPNLEAFDWGNWSLTSTGIFFVTPEQPTSTANVMFYDFTTQAVTPRAHLPRGTLRDKPGIAVSPDGTTLLFTQTDKMESDIMLVDNRL